MSVLLTDEQFASVYKAIWMQVNGGMTDADMDASILLSKDALTMLDDHPDEEIRWKAELLHCESIEERLDRNGWTD